MIGGDIEVPGAGFHGIVRRLLPNLQEDTTFAGDGIWVSLVEPGSYRTDIFEANRRIARRALEPGAPHEEASRRILGVLAEMLARGAGDPRDVARRIVKIATSRRPRLRTLVGTDAWRDALAKALLPERAVEAAILAITRLRPP